MSTTLPEITQPSTTGSINKSIAIFGDGSCRKESSPAYLLPERNGGIDMANFGSPAHTAAMGNAAGMMVLAAAGVGFSNAIGDAIGAAARAHYERRYDDALTTATAHAESMEELASLAMTMLAELEGENSRLRAACSQRQQVINQLKGRRP
ncbi:hypothetical protein [Rhizobium leguminosarum]|uniref:hypothetical protein n=1 Tax=Rhizobium leguminosarum TaxID=384 RepID=UPI001FEF6972|nr:hypothetical protein [Rhizobium leguminosarum]